MNDKLKDRILRLTNRLIVSLVFIVGMACCDSLTVYGAEEGLTEEEVKQQVVEILEAEGEDEEYDIDKIYQIVTLDYFVNDYIDGKSFEEIIETAKSKEIGEDNDRYTYWILPYENSKCFVTFLADDENVEMITKTVGSEINFDMKLYKGKFEEIDLEQVEEVVYLDLDLYGFKVVYVSLDNRMKYMIPYLQERIEEMTGLEYEKLYNIDDFIIKIYNCYEEQKDDKKIMEKANISSLISIRKRKLKCKNIDQVKKLNWIKKNKIMIFFLSTLSTVGIYFFICQYKKKKNRKKSI